MRSFIAINPPRQLISMVNKALDHSDKRRVENTIRWVRPENVHLTLKFLGEIESEQVDAIRDVLEDLARSSVRFAIGAEGFGCFPNPNRPRVIWIGLKSEEDSLRRLHRRLDEKLEGIGIRRDTREFHPHLTVGRVRKGLSSSELKELSSWLNGFQVGRLGSFEVREIKLMQSVLEPTGAVYSVLHAATIP